MFFMFPSVVMATVMVRLPWNLHWTCVLWPFASVPNFRNISRTMKEKFIKNKETLTFSVSKYFHDNDNRAIAMEFARDMRPIAMYLQAKIESKGSHCLANTA